MSWFWDVGWSSWTPPCWGIISPNGCPGESWGGGLSTFRDHLQARKGSLLTTSPREAERKAARQLGVRPDQLARATWFVYGRGFIEERDRRAVARVGDAADAATLRAARRRASMQLLSEFRRFTSPPDDASTKEW
jgi:hypothetical protein